MSFIDSVKYIERFAVTDEFGGRGKPEKISCFYIVLRVTDENGEPIEITFGDIEDAVRNEQLVLTDYVGFNDISLGLADDSLFKVTDAKYYKENNFIYVKPVKYKGDISVCVKIQGKKDGDLFASTCYLSDFPSTFYLSRS
jgi:hypothetical protein